MVKKRLLDIAAKVLPGRTLMVYQEVFDNNITLPDKIVFGVWKARSVKMHTGPTACNTGRPLGDGTPVRIPVPTLLYLPCWYLC